MKEELVLEKVYQNFIMGAEIKIDSRLVKKGDIFLGLKGKKFDGNNFAEQVIESKVSMIILDSSIKYQEVKEKLKSNIFLVQDSSKFLIQLAKKYRENLSIPFLGITGSNGKTTTKELIAKVLSLKYKVFATEGNLNNHLGVPLSILAIKKEHQFAIIEMGANHLGEIKILAEIAKPKYGIITNISEAHIGEFGSFENIVKTKTELYTEVLKNNGKIFINPKDSLLMEKSCCFLVKDRIFYETGKVLNNKTFLEVEISGKKIKTKLMGRYNLFNLQAAYTAGRFFKINEDKIREALFNYKPSNNRSQFSKTDLNNSLVIDCYNANPESMSLSIDSFSKLELKKEKVYLLGEMAELGKHSSKEHKKILEKIYSLNGEKILVGEEFLKFKNSYPYFKYFSGTEKLKDFLKKEKIKNKLILLKGSNRVRLIEVFNEKVI